MGTTEHEPDEELAELAARVADARAAIADIQAHRARVERSAAPLPPSDPTNDALRAKIEAARARLAELSATPTRRSPSVEASLRQSLAITGVVIAAPGLLTFGVLLWQKAAHPETEMPSLIALVVALPVVLGLALVARARFAKYRADSGNLDGDFL